MKTKKEENGITIVTLVITIIILLILAGVTLNAIIGENGLIGKTKYAKFVTNYREVEEKTRLYKSNKIIDEIVENKTGQSIPAKRILELEDKEQIKNKNKTLEDTIKQVRGVEEIDNIILWEIEQSLIETNKTHTYLIDDSGIIYDFEGEKALNKMWHIPEIGIGKSGNVNIEEDGDDMWDGWITLTLYYPDNSTNRKWRIGEEGKVREDEIEMWQDYTGPITVRIKDIDKIWIKYDINKQTEVIAPNGKVVVDIEPEHTGKPLVESTKVKINYDKDAIVKEYKIGKSNWKEYTEDFIISENVLIQARAKKLIEYENELGQIETVERWGYDGVYINNIKIKKETESLEAPKIERLAPNQNVDGEVARIRIQYPENANKRIYKQNYGKENEYIEEISISEYGTYIIAYYYSNVGNKSKSVGILINDTNNEGETTDEELPEEYIPNGCNPDNIEEGFEGDKENNNTSNNTSTNTSEGNNVINGETTENDIKTDDGKESNSKEMDTIIEAPEIKIIEQSENGIIKKANVTIVPTQSYQKIYIKVGNSGYKEYTKTLTIEQNCDIEAYYITEKGENSKIAYGRVDCIRIDGVPYVRIHAVPYPDGSIQKVDNVNITIIAENANKVEYSTDGANYKIYNQGQVIQIKENCTIYARAINNNGENIETLNITNIKGDIPKQNENISVNIVANPEPIITTDNVEKVNIKIEYGNKAINKKYKIGQSGEIRDYIGEFQVTKNCTIYAYASSENGYGENSKIIDNIKNNEETGGEIENEQGIAEPIIIVENSDNKKLAKAIININYDKTATSKQYKIGNSEWKDYTGEFEVEENCIIYAKNTRGKALAKSQRKITNIVKISNETIINKGDYYIIKLNYPEGASKRQYKIMDSDWKNYNDDGIILIKPSAKDKILDSNGKLNKIEDENGKTIRFKGDYYILETPITEIFEHIQMKWDRGIGAQPKIVVSPMDITREVKISIGYNESLVKKEYKIENPDGKTDGWKEYKEEIIVNRNNTIIYARGKDITNTYTKEAMKKIDNIDEEQPVIKLVADFENVQRKVNIKVKATDDYQVKKVKWAAGQLGENDFLIEGYEIQNNTVVTIENEGYYTFYAEDMVGNKQVYTINVTNIDKIPPSIDIQVNPETQVTSQIKVNIDYGDSDIRKYKIGENSNNWIDYNGEISITSDDMFNNPEVINNDQTITIYAKGKDLVGNEKTVLKKIVNLDLDKIQEPQIESNYGYPLLTPNGVILEGKTKIIYDTRNDIENYYSIDDGQTWKKYEREIEATKGTVKAKSIRKTTGLEIEVSKEIKMPEDALTPEAYDGNINTSSTWNGTKTKYINVDSSLWGEIIKISKDSTGEVYFSDLENQNKTIMRTNDYCVEIMVPYNTNKILFTGNGGNIYIKEIEILIKGKKIEGKDIFVSNKSRYIIDKEDNLLGIGHNYLLNRNINTINKEKQYILQGNKFKKITSTNRANSSTPIIAIDNNGYLWSWGLNPNGVLGREPVTTSTIVMADKITKDVKFKDVYSSGAGNNFAIGLDENGYLWSWGCNVAGRLGQGDEISGNRIIPNRVSSKYQYKSIFVGDSSTYAIDEEGHLWSWGYNAGGELGDGTTKNTGTPKKIISQVKFKTVAPGNGYAIAIDEEGYLWSWGKNEYGQLGDGTKTKRTIPQKILQNNKFKSVVTSNNHTVMAIDNNDDVWSWGNNSQAQLGRDTDGQQSDSIPQKILFNTKIKQIALDSSSSFAIDENGDVWSWGNNDQGQLGFYIENIINNKPIKALSSLNVQKIVSCNNMSLALCENGNILEWGNNAYSTKQSDVVLPRYIYK